MRKIVLRFGLIAGAILSLMMIIATVFWEHIGFDKGEIVGYSSMVLAFLLIYFGIRAYRDNVAGGSVRFGRAFTVGVLIATVGSICYVATWMVIYENFAPNFVVEYQEHVVETARQEGATAVELQQLRDRMAKFAELYKNPIVHMAFTFLEPLPVALIISLVSAGILSRSNRESGNRLTERYAKGIGD